VPALTWVLYPTPPPLAHARLSIRRPPN